MKLKKEKISMRKSIIILTNFFIVLAIVMLTTVNVVKLKSNLKGMIQNAGYRIAEDVRNKIKDSYIIDETLNESLNEKSLAVAYSCEFMDFKTINNEKLKELANSAKVTYISIIDKTKNVIYSNNEKAIGFSFKDDHEMNSLFEGKKTVCVEEIRESILEGKRVKFVGVALKNGYFVQVGTDVENLMNIRSNINMDTVSKNAAKSDEILYVGVLDTNMIQIAGSDDDNGEKYENKFVEEAIKNKKEYKNIKFSDKLKANTYEIVLPLEVNDEYIGGIEVQMSFERLEKTVKKSIINTVGLAIVIIIICTVILSYIIRKRLKPLVLIANNLRYMSEGDYSKEMDENLVHSKDEIGLIYKSALSMKKNTVNLINELKDACEVLFHSSSTLSSITDDSERAVKEIAISMENITQKSSEQVAYIDDIVNKSETLENEISETIEHLEESIEISNRTELLGVQGLEIVKNLEYESKLGIGKISNITSIIKDVNSSADNAQYIIDIINNIAKQTNLLALNASIEAARAGEVGRGFSVVAEEIRKLSEDTSNATNNIQDLIGNIQYKVKDAVDSIEGIGNAVNSQEEAVSKTTEIFNNTSVEIKKLVGYLKDVREHANNMEESKEKINSAISEISILSEKTSQSTQEVLACTEEQLASVEEISCQSDESQSLSRKLDEQINMFKI
ncbi:methyl-accepting chemotaxis protein [Clostridium ihumii]|uniref:methyl-accepting chemotaxis protein n=1 Tax=Clostridium ihumii TaxID=1470356 RepID=UPI003D34C64B